MSLEVRGRRKSEDLCHVLPVAFLFAVLGEGAYPSQDHSVKRRRAAARVQLACRAAAEVPLAKVAAE